VKKLNENYFRNCFLDENELVKEVITRYLNWYSDKSKPSFISESLNHKIEKKKSKN
jgi:hypothetical protein